MYLKNILSQEWIEYRG